MSVRIAIQTPGLNLHTLLADEALQALMELVQKHRITPEPGQGRRGLHGGPPPFGPGHRPMRGPGGHGPGHEREAPVPQRDREALTKESIAVREQMAGMTLAQLGTRTENRSFQEKVIMLAAFAESRPGAMSVTRLVLRDLFVRLRERPPANFGREMRVVWDLGLVDFPERKEVAVTNAGWSRVAELVGN